MTDIDKFSEGQRAAYGDLVRLIEKGLMDVPLTETVRQSAERIASAVADDGFLVKDGQIWKVVEIDYQGLCADGDSVAVMAYVEAA